MNAVMVKDLRMSAWRWQAYAGRGVYVALVALIVLEFVMSTTARAEDLSPSEYAILGRRLFVHFLWLNLALVAFASILVTADAVTKEVRTGTIDLLTTSPLSALRICTGKWLAGMAYSGCLVLCGLPVLAACLYLGGVGFEEVAWCFSLTIGTAAVGAAIGLRASTARPNVERSVVTGVWWFLGYAVGPLAIAFLGAWPAMFALPFLHPLYAAYTACFPPAQVFSQAWVLATPCAFVAAWLIVKSAAKRLQLRGKLLEQASAPMAADVSRSRGGWRNLWKARGAQSPAPLKDISVWDHDPLLWKELSTRASGHIAHEVKQSFVIYFILLSVPAYVMTQGAAWARAMFDLVFVLLAALQGATLFTRDKEGRRLELLLCTPFTPAQIVRAKLMAGVMAPEPIVAGVLWAGTAALWGFKSGFGGMLSQAAASILFVGFTYALAGASSLKAKTLHGAALSSAGIVVGLLFVLPFVVSTFAGPTPILQHIVTAMHPYELARQGTWMHLAAYASIYAAAIVALLVGMVRGVQRTGERT